MNFSQSQLTLDSLRAPIESYLLVDAVSATANELVLDIGCGSGILALSLAVKYPQLKLVVGIELVCEHLKVAQSKCVEFNQINKKRAPCEWVNGDARTFLLKQCLFDVIVSNPPFYPTFHGKHSPSQAKANAHMDDSLSPEELLNCVHQYLKPQGRFYMVYPLSRIDEVKYRCEIHRFCIVKQVEHLDVRKRSGGIAVLTIQQESNSL